ncbi:MAG: tripartite tricarboxylate transporter TctB family protein [Burkholderiales bacterium]
MSRDGIAGLAVLAASLVLFALTLDLKDNPMVPVGPGLYPRIVLGLTAVLSLGLVIGDVLARRRLVAASGPKKDKLNYRLVAISFGVFALYAVALPWLGFRIATVLFVGGANALLDPPRGARGWGRALVLALLTSLVTWLVFERWLSVLLPRGRWTGF